MKAKTIYAIRKILIDWSEIACKDFEKYDKKLRETYGDRYNSLCTQTEKEIWITKRNNFNDSQDCLDDFEHHIWN